VSENNTELKCVYVMSHTSR